jgi:hypothetical protein
MRSRTVRLVALSVQGFLVYLVLANIFAQSGVINLPLSYGVFGPSGFALQILLIALQLVVVLIASLLINKQKASSVGRAKIACRLMSSLGTNGQDTTLFR